MQGLEFDRAVLVHKLLQETPAKAAEWILYMDQQTLFDQPSFVFNFEFYAGRDLVLSCDTWKIKAGETGAQSPCSTMLPKAHRQAGMHRN